MKKTQWPLILMLLLVAADLFAAGNGQFTSMEQGMGEAKESTQSMIGHAIWIFAFIPMGAAWWAYKTAKEHMENREETSQFEPKWQKMGKLWGAALGGIALTFLGYGVIGEIFLNKGFMDTWTLFVVNFWVEIASYTN